MCNNLDALYWCPVADTLISLIAKKVGINMEGGIFWKKRGVEGGKNVRNQ